jgi:hypothetical protein
MPETLVINGITYVTLDQAMQMVADAERRMKPLPPEMSVAEAAKEAHCDQRRIRAAIAAGELKARIPNGCKRGRRVSRASLYEWMQGRDAAGVG